MIGPVVRESIMAGVEEVAHSVQEAIESMGGVESPCSLEGALQPPETCDCCLPPSSAKLGYRRLTHRPWEPPRSKLQL